MPFIRHLSHVAPAIALTAHVATAGDTNPPAGPVASTMKTLSEVEPRTPISAANTPGDADSVYRIATPGSYYLTGNITGEAFKHGIEIFTSDVTIDLMGFTLLGVTDSLDGIHAEGRSNITIRNGTVRTWWGDGIDLGQGTDGANILIEGIHAYFNIGTGIIAGTTCVVRDCTANENFAGGITAFISTVESCAAYANGGIGIHVGFGSSVHNCMARQNGSGFVSLGFGTIFTSCHADNNSIGFDASQGTTVVHCSARGNLTNAIRVANKCLILENTCADSGVNILVTASDNRIEGNNVTGGSRGIDIDATDNLVIRNSASANSTDYDIVAGNTVGPIVTSANIATSTNPHANYEF